MKLSVSRQLSRVFNYPDEAYLASLQSLTDELQVQPKASEHLSCLAKAIGAKNTGELAELYSNTFDLCPACAPYLSVHLFGEENYKRSSLMTGLMEAYSNVGISCNGELPDHIAVVLAALDVLDDELRHDLVSFCLVPALDKMEAELRRLDNPYLHAVLALKCWFTQPQAKAEVQCA